MIIIIFLIGALIAVAFCCIVLAHQVKSLEMSDEEFEREFNREMYGVEEMPALNAEVWLCEECKKVFWFTPEKAKIKPYGCPHCGGERISLGRCFNV